ncbi:MAG: KR domain-containing protein [Egibacteraceae bacterium]
MRGQGNYAAANAFLDNFAAFRVAQGLPALTVKGLGGDNVMVCPDLADRSGGVCRASATDTSSMLHTTSFRQSGCALTGAYA